MTNVYNVTSPGNPVNPVAPGAPDVTIPGIGPQIEPRPTRYIPDPDHCPGQRVRTVRRIRRVLEP